MSAKLRGASIALPIFLLVIAAIVAATAVTFAITFAGPPPRPAPVMLADVAKALRGDAAMTMEGARTESIADAPTPRDGERADPVRDREIAALVGGGVVRGFYQQPPLGPSRAVRGAFTVGWNDGGGWRTVRSAPDRQFAKWLKVTLGGMLMALVVLGGIAWWVARAISRPLAELADHAARARLSAGPPPPPTGGPREVRALGDAFTAMHGRLAAHADNRTAMLAAIAHDLGTPLSRVAFWIEQLPEPARVRAAGDIEEMRAMLGDVLRFARDERTGTRDRIDLGSVIDALVEDLSVAGQPATILPGPRALVRGDATGLRRLFANLIENAIRYGDVARVGWDVTDDAAIVRIDDDGPGFDPALGERLFEPFVRGDPSRNRATGGTGLGLAIVRSLADAHGGRVTLGRWDGGGRVEVWLPLDAPAFGRSSPARGGSTAYRPTRRASH